MISQNLPSSNENNSQLYEIIDFQNSNKYLQDSLSQENTDIINYKNMILPNKLKYKLSDGMYNIDKGDVLLLDLDNKSKYKSIFNNILPKFDNSQKKWIQIDIIENISYNHIDFKKFLNKNLNIYSIYQFFEIFITNDAIKYVNQEKIKLHNIRPDKTFTRINNNKCYFTNIRNNLYLNLNKNKYNIHIDKIKNTQLYLIYKIEFTIKYYLTFYKKKTNVYYYWEKENISKINKKINNLVYINIKNNLEIQKHPLLKKLIVCKYF